MQFQCYICLFYCNNLENFLSHLESNEHEETRCLQKKLICLPWKFQCETTEELTIELSENCRNATDVRHPVIVLSSQVPLFCDFCMGTCNYTQNSIKSLQSLARKRIIYRNTANGQKKFFKKRLFRGQRNFILKECKKRSEMCNTKHPLSKETEKDCSVVHFSSAGTFETKSRTVCNVVNEGNFTDNALETNHCEGKKSVLVESSAPKDGDSQLFNTENSNKLFNCSKCEEKFTEKVALLRHLKLHFGKPIYRCFKCGFQAVKKSLLQRHEQTHSINRPRPFVCEICGSAQLYKWALVQHMRVHSEGAFKCESNGCQHVCRTRTELVQHQRVHTNERPYRCNLCEYSGKTAHQLKKHERTHTGERPFKCKHCSYSASLSHQLLRHMRVHTGSKPYKCPYCDYVCNNQENIRKHILKTKKHEGEKMYPCTFCSFGCNDFPEFQKHLLCSHKERFPKGLKDVESSVVVGLYKKDFPRSELTKKSLTSSKKV